MSDALPDSGLREEFETGASREPATDKGRYDLIPVEGLRRLAVHYERGANKYAERNWEKGLPLSRTFDSTVRHLYAWLAGDTSEDHLAAAAWGCMALMTTAERIEAMTLPMNLWDVPARQP